MKKIIYLLSILAIAFSLQTSVFAESDGSSYDTYQPLTAEQQAAAQQNFDTWLNATFVSWAAKSGVDLNGYSVSASSVTSAHGGTYNRTYTNAAGQILQMSYCMNAYFSIVKTQACVSGTNSCGRMNSGLATVSITYYPDGRIQNQTVGSCSATTPSESACTACQPGTGMSGAQNTCVPCAANQITQTNQCVTCPAGQMPNAARNACVPSGCTPGTGMSGAQNTCVPCAANQVTQNNQCVTCPAGQMPNAARTACVPTTSSCTPGTGMSGAQNTCVPCAANQVTQNNQCATCPAGQMPDANKTSCVPSNCAAGQVWNGARCISCAANEVPFNGVCRQCDNGGCTQGKCNNGANNPPFCSACNTPQYYFNSSSKSCVPNPCPNNMVPPGNYGQTCQGGTNACGQPSTGTVQCDGRCVGGSNNTCITSFTPNTTSIQPNGSVEFFYKILPPASGTQQTCGFYDRSQSKGPDGLGVPIPGLQNLDTSKERIRINNIQRNTEFCLVCRFTTNDGTPQAPAANHQWVRVIRIGEN